MDTVFLTLLNRSIAAGWLVLAVAALRFPLRRAPKAIRCVLWAFVGIRLVCPFSLESVLSLIPSAETFSPDLLYSGAPAIHSGIAVLNRAVNPVIAEPLAPAAASMNPMRTAAQIASIVWIAGALLLLLYAVVSYVRLRRSVADAVRLRENLWQSEKAAAPFVLGLFRPRIYLQYGMDDERAACVVAHERAHIRRRDHWIKPLGFLLLTVYWFNPLLWLAYALLCRDIELACDERVVRELGPESKRAYSEALLALSVPRRALSACPLAFGEVGVGQRIKNVLNYKKPAFWLIAATLLVCAATAACFLTNPKAAPAADPFGRTYRVEAVDYTDGRYSFAYTPEGAPDYFFTAERLLAKREKGQGEWETLGGFSEIALTVESFDGCFFETGALPGDFRASSIRQNNHRAWRVDATDAAGEVFYLVLQQKNGDLYLTYGYRAPGGDAGASIRWLFRLAAAELPPGPLADENGEVYVSSACVYMNPVSSYFSPDGDNGCRYLVGEDSFTLAKAGTGDVLARFSLEWDWEDMSADEWQALFQFGVLFVPDISAFERPMRLRLSDRYTLFNMDGALWIGETLSEKVGIWSVYALVPHAEHLLTLQEALALSRYGDQLSWEHLERYAYSDIGSGLYVYVFPIDEHWQLTVSGAAGFSYGEKIPDTVSVRLKHLPDGESADLRGGEPAALVAEKESARSEAPMVFSGAGLCAMVPAYSGEDLGFLLFDPAHAEKHMVPFSVFADGKEVRGGDYTITDSETGEALDFFHPSGLPTQTYLLRNAEPGRGYKVTLRHFDEAGDTAYAFCIYIN